VSYTQLTLLFNKIDHIALEYVRSNLFSLFSSSLLFSSNQSFSARQSKRERKGGENGCKCACGRVIIMTVFLFVSSWVVGIWLASLLNRLHIYVCTYTYAYMDIENERSWRNNKSYACITRCCLCIYVLDYNSRRYLFLTVSFFFWAFFSQSETENILISMFVYIDNRRYY
jgi:hypothetical protein